jgi:DNA invertase Pin-like site-specific DNA recombinase
MTATLESPVQLVHADVWGVYLRRSVADDDAGVLRHRKRGARFCEENGYAPKFYVDNDRPASEGSARREGFDEMLADIASGVLRGVWVFEQSRLTRDTDESSRFMRLVKKHRVLVAVKERVYDLTRATDRHTFRADANDATMEVERTSERLAEMFDDVINTEGRSWWPCRPFGFNMSTTDDDGERVAPTLNKDEAQLIEHAYKDVLRGRSMRAIAREWNDRGVRTPTRRIKATRNNSVTVPAHNVGGIAWTGNAIRRLLLNPRNAGLRERLHTEKRSGQRIITKREILAVRAEWPPIVSEELYYGVAAILQSQQRGPNSYTRKYLLTGLAICGKCHKNVGSIIQRGRASYACPHCHGITRSMADVDRFVRKVVCNRLTRDDAKDLCRRDDVDAERIAEVEERITALTKIRKSLREQARAAAKRGDALDVAECEDEIAATNKDIDELKASITAPARAEVLEDAIDADDPAQYFLAAPLDRQRAMINELGTITIMPGQPPRGGFKSRFIVVTGELLGGI